MELQTPTLVEVIQRLQIGLQKSLFRYQTSQYNYAFAVAELDKYQDEYFRAKNKLYNLVGGY